MKHLYVVGWQPETQFPYWEVESADWHLDIKEKTDVKDRPSMAVMCGITSFIISPVQRGTRLSSCQLSRARLDLEEPEEEADDLGPRFSGKMACSRHWRT
jgi:hypothetical protein